MPSAVSTGAEITTGPMTSGALTVVRPKNSPNETIASATGTAPYAARDARHDSSRPAQVPTRNTMSAGTRRLRYVPTGRSTVTRSFHANPAAHPNARFTAPASQCPSIAPEWEDPKGVPISAILFGGRRKTTVPLVTQARDWQHGVFIGATLGSEQTAAAEGKVGAIRRDPMAMLPFLGYNVGDYFQHWIDLGKNSDESKMPKVFFVNWFRRGDDGRFLWPGFGENSRVLKWAIERIEHKADGRTTPIGIVPSAENLDLEGLDVDAADVDEALAVNAAEWRDELPLIEEWFEFVGEKLPTGIKDEFDALKHRLAEAD